MQVTEKTLSVDTEENLETLMARVETVMKRWNISRLEAMQLLGLHSQAAKEKASKRADWYKFIETVLSSFLGLWREFKDRRDGKL